MKGRLVRVGAFAMPVYIIIGSLSVVFFAWAWPIVLRGQPTTAATYVFIAMLIAIMVLNVLGHICGVVTVQYLMSRRRNGEPHD